MDRIKFLIAHLVQDVDRAMACARCQNTLNRLDWLDETPNHKETISDATEEMLEGLLRNNRGTVSGGKQDIDWRVHLLLANENLAIH